MKKKFMVLAMIALLAVASVSAVGFQLGASWNTGFPYEKVANGQEITFEEFIEPNGMNYGPDVRLNLNFFDIGNTFHLSYKDYVDGKGLWYTNEVYADVYIPILFLKPGVGLGMQTVIKAGDASELVTMDNFLAQSILNYRATVGFKLGSFEIDVQYFVPGGASVQAAIDNPDLVADLFTPKFEASRVGIAALYEF